MRSARVYLPWSMWAMIEKLRMWSIGIAEYGEWPAGPAAARGGTGGVRALAGFSPAALVLLVELVGRKEDAASRPDTPGSSTRSPPLIARDIAYLHADGSRGPFSLKTTVGGVFEIGAAWGLSVQRVVGGYGGFPGSIRSRLVTT